MQQQEGIQPKRRARRSLCFSLFIRLAARYTGAKCGRSRKNERREREGERERERERTVV